MKILNKLDKNLFKDFALTLISFTFVGFGNMLIYYLLPIFLSTTDSEIFAVFKKTSSLLLVFLIGGMAVAIPKFVLENSKEKSSLYLLVGFFFSVSLTIIALIIFLIFPEYFGLILIGKSLVFKDIFCLFAIIFSGVVNGTIYSYFRGIYIVNEANLLVIIISLLQILLIFISKDIFIYIMLNALSSIIVSVMFLLSFTDFYYQSRKLITKDFLGFKRIIIYGFLRVPGDFSLEGLNSLPVLITSATYGIALGGQMAYAMTIFGLILAVMSPVNFIMLPKVSLALNVDKDFNMVKKIVKQSFIIIFPLIFIAGFVIFFLSEFIAIAIFHSKQPIILSVYIKFICIAVLPFSVYTMLRSIIDAGYTYPLNSFNCIVSLIVFGCIQFVLKDYEYGLLISVILGYTYLGLSTYISYINIFKKGK